MCVCVCVCVVVVVFGCLVFFAEGVLGVSLCFGEYI